MVIKQFPVGPFQMNAYIIHQENNNECLLIDPGDDLHVLEDYMQNKDLKPAAIFNTHAHIDHVRFLSRMQKKYDLPFYLAKEELPLLENLQNQGNMFGIETAEPAQVTNYLVEGEKYDIAGLKFSTIHAPGHSPGSICFLFEQDLIAGDVLFYDSIGRTDLYMGSYEQLIDSIKTKLLVLDDHIRVHPGHGPSTTIGRERAHNPFLQ